MRTTDQMLARTVAEIEEKQTFIDGLVEIAEKETRDLNSQEMEMITRARTRMGELNEQAEAMADTVRISNDSAKRLAEISRQVAPDSVPAPLEYRTAGDYALDMWQAGLGDEPARERIHRYALENRAAAHTTTSTATGLVPTPILAPVISFVDAARPLVSALGPRQLPSWSFSRPKVTQHTAVAAQSAEKAELTSQALTITKLAVTPQTFGGYCNVSRQLIDFGTVGGSAMDIVINDLAAQYAIQTEAAAVQAFYTGATAGGTIDATPTAAEVSAIIWAAAGSVYTATKGIGRLLIVCSPDVLGIIGPLFAPINPVDAQSQGFTANAYGQGVLGAISGVSVVVTAGFAAAKSMLVMSSAAAEVYEDRIGPLQVVEPSVLGVQVAFAGHFAKLITEATGIIKVTVT